MAKIVRIDSGYEPRPIFEPYHERTQRFSVGVAHRRAGKTVAHIAELIRDAITISDEPRCAYIAPTFTQAKDIAWGYLKRFGLVIPGAEANESELRLDLPNGGRVRLYGAENADRLRGLYFDHVVLDEYAQMRPGIWGEIIRPALSDRKGKASFIGTPMGRNQFWEIYEQAQTDPAWFHFMLRASATHILPEEELRDARKTMTPEQYEQEYECSFTAAIIGAYFGKEMADAEREGRICSVPHDPAVSVQTWWDLGIDDSTAIWFVQYVGREIHVIDYIETNGEALPYYAKELDKRPYRYDAHILPHDAAARELGTGKTRVETLQGLGLRSAVVTPAQDVSDGINAARLIIPRCWFDAAKCKRGIEALRQYRREYDDKLRAFKSKPLHDWCFTGDTRILTRYGTHRIMDLPPIGEVLTPCGWKLYTNPRVTRRNARLVEVGFADGSTVRCTPDHMFLTESGWKSASDLTTDSLILSSLTPLRSILMAAYTAVGRVTDIGRAAARNCIAMFGRLLSAPSLAAVTSTTETRTRITIPYRIWSAWLNANISATHGTSRDTNDLLGLASSLLKRRRNGTARKRGGYGTGATPSEPRAGRSGNASRVIARLAERISTVWSGLVGTVKSIAHKPAKSLHITSVTPLAERADVWCLTVPDGEAFSLANGAVVHNCSHGADAFRTGAMGGRVPSMPKKPKMHEAGSGAWMG